MKLLSLFLFLIFNILLKGYYCNYANSVILNNVSPNMQLEWTVNSDAIIGRLSINCTCWIAFALTENDVEKMDKSDFIIFQGDDVSGWQVNDYFLPNGECSDGYTPCLDTDLGGQNDVKLTCYEISNGRTSFEFERKLVTNDINDHPFEQGAHLILYANGCAYNQTKLDYHGDNRNSQIVTFFTDNDQSISPSTTSSSASPSVSKSHLISPSPSNSDSNSSDSSQDFSFGEIFSIIVGGVTVIFIFINLIVFFITINKRGNYTTL
eukprot:TRINITY_DN1236_c0_g5_i1.p1 TRINITY_DN1236_c0_g5~~TRINITY_DN1236_c0_g5_i1.p1  ORF type:complete len:265 (-),score=110.00 TRINITY_DN1236_c0_g5_i1:626-1420(-)